MQVFADYNELLESRGISLADMNVRDVGLLRDDALLAIDLLRRAEIPILGGEVWCRSNGKLELTYENWHADPDRLEDQRAYSQRSCMASEQYVRDFPERTDAELLFVFVIAR